MVKIFDLVSEKYWVTSEDGELFLYNNEEEAREILRKEGYKEEYINTGIEFHLHTPIDKTGYELL
jgi:hypothetical protein